MDLNHPHHAVHVRIGIIAVAVLLTAAFHYLVAGRWFGIGLAIFAVLLVIGIHVVDVLAAKPNNTWAYIFLVPLITAAAAECLLGSDVVRVLALLIMIVSSAMFAYWFTAPRVGFWEAPVLWPASAALETIWPYYGMSRMTAGFSKTDRLRKIFLGLIIAAPVAIVILVLFVGADAVFGKVVTGLFDLNNAAINIYRVVRDVIVLLFLAASGWTIYTRVSDSRKAKTTAAANVGDQTVITTFLAVLNVLFLVFIAFQATAFFGGEKFIQAQGVSYADYARDGFFQLLAVAGIVFVIMIAVYRYTHLRAFGSRLLGMALIVETGVIIVSAVRRLALYIDAYGLTLSRYWAMVVIIIIAAVLATLLIGALAKIKYETIVRVVFVGLLVIFPFLLLANVEGGIVRFNFDRFASGKTDKFDSAYLSGYADSSDAVPALMAALRAPWPTTAKQGVSDKSVLYNALSQKSVQLQNLVSGDWRKITVVDYRALASLGALKEIDVLSLVPKKYIGDIKFGQYDVAGAIFLEGKYLLPTEIDGNLYIEAGELQNIKALPTTVTGDVTISGVNDVFNLSIDNIGGSLIVIGWPINKFGILPKVIGRDLDLKDVALTTVLPSGLSLGGSVLVSSETAAGNKDFLANFMSDALAKSYRVTAEPNTLPSSIIIPPAPNQIR